MSGRFPANLLLTHSVYCAEECHTSCPVAMMDAQSGISKSPPTYTRNVAVKEANTHGAGFLEKQSGAEAVNYGDSGGASRYFAVFRWTEEDFV